MIFWEKKMIFRLHGSYEVLRFATSVDIFNELTGGATEVVPIVGDGNEAKRIITQAAQATCIMSAFVDFNAGNGDFVAGQNYSISGIEQVKKSRFF